MKIEFSNTIIESDNYEFMLGSRTINEKKCAVIVSVNITKDTAHEEIFNTEQEAQQRFNELMNILSVWSREKTAGRYVHDKELEHQYKQEREFLIGMQHNKKLNES